MSFTTREFSRARIARRSWRSSSLFLFSFFFRLKERDKIDARLIANVKEKSKEKASRRRWNPPFRLPVATIHARVNSRMKDN